MGKLDKLRQRIISGTSDTGIAFKALCNLLRRLEFDERIRGDHHIFTRDDVDEIINLQPVGSISKPYQVKQVRNIIIKYHLGEQDVE